MFSVSPAIAFEQYSHSDQRVVHVYPGASDPHSGKFFCPISDYTPEYRPLRRVALLPN